MFAVLINLYLLFCVVNLGVQAQEPMCKFTFQEQILEKMVRFEFRVETMLASISKAQLEMSELTSKVNKELGSIVNERELITKQVSDYKTDLQATLQRGEQQMTMNLADFESKIVRFSEDFADFKTNVSSLARGQSVTYIRWGRTTCPDVSNVVYDGFASGSHYSNPGGPSNTICLPKDPQEGNVYQGQQGSYIYNVQFESNGRTSTIFGEAMEGKSIPCVVCEASTRTAMLVVPARKECYDGWQFEYTGYLMTSYHSGQHRSDMKCVDANPQTISGSSNGERLYFVEEGSSVFPRPYRNGVELTCAVCTK